MNRIGQAYRQVIFVENQAAQDNFTGGRFEFGASAFAVAVTAGAQASAGMQGASAAAGAGSPNTGTATGYVDGMQTFTIAEGGLMYAATIGGQRYNIDRTKVGPPRTRSRLPRPTSNPRSRHRAADRA